MFVEEVYASGAADESRDRRRQREAAGADRYGRGLACLLYLEGALRRLLAMRPVAAPALRPERVLPPARSRRVLGRQCLREVVRRAHRGLGKTGGVVDLLALPVRL